MNSRFKIDDPAQHNPTATSRWRSLTDYTGYINVPKSLRYVTNAYIAGSPQKYNHSEPVDQSNIYGPL